MRRAAGGVVELPAPVAHLYERSRPPHHRSSGLRSLRTRWPRAAGPRVLMVDPDPYLAFLVRSTFPDAVVATSDEAELLGSLAGRVDIAVLDLDTPAASRFMARQPGVKVVGIATGTRMTHTARPATVEGLVYRPFSPAELSSALLRAAGSRRALLSVRQAPTRAVLGWLLTARVAIVVMGALLQVAAHAWSGPKAWLLAGILMYLAVSTAFRRDWEWWRVMDLVVASTAMLLTGGITSPYAPFGVAAAAATALTLGSAIGALGGLVPMVGPVIAIAKGGGATSGQTAVFALFPLASLLGAVLGHLSQRHASHSTELASEANRALSSLFRLARALPGGFDLAAVAKAALEEVEAAIGAPCGVLLLREANVVRVVGSFGLGEPAEPPLPDDPKLDAIMHGDVVVLGGADLPATIATQEPGKMCWLAAPLAHGGVAFGAILVVCPDCDRHPESQTALRAVAYESGLAVENARLFRQVQELSASQERQRLGGELHDGLAQALYHLRLELELLSRTGTSGQESLQSETARLARVASTALTDLQDTIKGLRAQPAGGLAGAFASYLSDLRSLGGPQVEFVTLGKCQLPQHLEAEVFRVGQEAVSNALRHASASHITITLAQRGMGASLVVEDDGQGMERSASQDRPRSTGVGLLSMGERARRLGGNLSICSSETTGTRVELVIEPDAVEAVTA